MDLVSHHLCCVIGSFFGAKQHLFLSHLSKKIRDVQILILMAMTMCPKCCNYSKKNVFKVENSGAKKRTSASVQPSSVTFVSLCKSVNASTIERDAS